MFDWNNLLKIALPVAGTVLTTIANSPLEDNTIKKQENPYEEIKRRSLNALGTVLSQVQPTPTYNSQPMIPMNNYTNIVQVDNETAYDKYKNKQYLYTFR